MSTQTIDRPAAAPQDAAPRSLKELVDDYERGLIQNALRDCGGHQRRAARALGILPTTLSEKMRRLRLRRHSADTA